MNKNTHNSPEFKNSEVKNYKTYGHKRVTAKKAKHEPRGAT